MSDLDRTDANLPEPQPDLVINPATESTASDPQGVSAAPQSTPEPVRILPDTSVESTIAADQDTDSERPKEPEESLELPKESVTKPVTAPQTEAADAVPPAQPGAWAPMQTTSPAQAKEPTQTSQPAQTSKKEPLDMWAVVRDSDTANPQAPSTSSAAPIPSHSEALEPPVLTGEEVQMTAPKRTEGIVGEPLNHDVETATIEPVTAAGAGATHGIPQLLPDQSHAPADSQVDSPTTPRLPESTEQAQTWASVPHNSEESPLERTAVQRRSLITPMEEPEPTPEPEATWRPRETVPEDQTLTETPDGFDSQVFAGATVVPTVPKRGKWHALSILITLILVPVMWYLAADAANRFTLNIGYITDGTVVDLSQRLIPVGELVGMIVALVLVVECAVRSSVGAQVIGIIVGIVGLPWVVVPDFTANTIYPLMESAFRQGAFLQNVGHHLQNEGYSGRMLLLGLVIWMFGMISHRVRRRGRSEQAIRTEVRRLAPPNTSAE